MANEKNLIPQAHKLTVEEASRGGRASGEARRERKTFREGLLMLLQEELKDQNGNATGKTAQDAIIAGIVKRAAKGDTRAFEVIRDTIGEKPVEHVSVSTDDQEILAEVARRMAGDAQ